MGVAVKYNWPSDFPSDCPPESAYPAEGEMYRFVKNNPPVQRDFKRWFDESYNSGKEKSMSSGQKCFAYALSVFGSLEGAIKKFEFYKPRLEKEQCGIAVGKLDASVGLMLPRGAYTHHELWLQVGVEPHKYINKIGLLKLKIRIYIYFLI